MNDKDRQTAAKEFMQLVQEFMLGLGFRVSCEVDELDETSVTASIRPLVDLTSMLGGFTGRLAVMSGDLRLVQILAEAYTQSVMMSTVQTFQQGNKEIEDGTRRNGD